MLRGVLPKYASIRVHTHASSDYPRPSGERPEPPPDSQSPPPATTVDGDPPITREHLMPPALLGPPLPHSLCTCGFFCPGHSSCPPPPVETLRLRHSFNTPGGYAGSPRAPGGLPPSHPLYSAPHGGQIEFPKMCQRANASPAQEPSMAPTAFPLPESAAHHPATPKHVPSLFYALLGAGRTWVSISVPL